MPNLYLKINEKFYISDSKKKSDPDDPPPFISTFEKGNFVDISISTLPNPPVSKVGFVFTLENDNLVSGDFQINQLDESVEVKIDAIFKISVKPVAFDILNPETKWIFNGLAESGTWNRASGEIKGLAQEEYTQGQGEWKRSFTRSLIAVKVAKTLKEIK